MTSINPYAVLGVERNATEEEIRAAYIKLVKTCHPDTNPGADAEARFKELNEANEILSDPDLRSHYDATGKDIRDRERFIHEEAKQIIISMLNTLTNTGSEQLLTQDVFGIFRRKIEMSVQESLNSVRMLKNQKRKLKRLVKGLRGVSSDSFVLTAIGAMLGNIDSRIDQEKDSQAAQYAALKLIFGMSFDFKTGYDYDDDEDSSVFETTALLLNRRNDR